MKEKIYLVIIGVLVGAVLSTGAFYIYTITSNKCECNTQNTQMNGGQPPEMPSGENNHNGEPPEKPDGESGTPPAKPEDNQQSNSN